MSDANSSRVDLLSRLSLALTRINQTVPRTIASPATQPRRASVAILIRVKPDEDDDEWLSEQYDADGQPLPGSEAERIMFQSGLGLGTDVDEKIDLPQQGKRGVTESFTSTGKASLSSGDASFMEVSGTTSTVEADLSGSSAVDLAGISTGNVREASSSPSSSSSLEQPKSSSQSPPSLSPTSASQKSADANHSETNLTLQRFFSLPWVRRGQPEILYIKRASRMTDKWSSHVAFPGGRKEDEDENGLYTAMRETWEEIGLDLAEKEFVNVGKLDDREITTSLGKRLLMVLSPYIFVQTSPFSPIPDLQPSEVASAHWIPLSLLYTPNPSWGSTSVDIASRLAPKSPAVRWALRVLVGKMDFRCILLPNKPIAIAEEQEGDDDFGDHSPTLQREKGFEALSESNERPELKLWGLTLGMTLDLLSQMSSASGKPVKDTDPIHAVPDVTHLLRDPRSSARSLISQLRDELHLSPPPQASAMAPSMTSVFPRFSYPDVNFWIWVFGFRYRTIVRSWERNIGTGMEQTVNWSGMALGAFYSAVRRALVIAIVLRALGFLSSFSAAFWLVTRRIRRSRKGLPGLGLEEIFPTR
ncbi:hypothetical protein CBS101457_004048 [Exobasidium rhododendri]|nr:hypothetical protein CBS101457_004048 [Exobasidium rhododendri]